MATWDLTSYTGLQAAIADTLNRKSLNDQIPGFIALHEAKANRELRVRDMETIATGTTAGRFTNLPADFASPISLDLTNGNVDYPDLSFVGTAEAKALRLKYRSLGFTTQPTHWTVVGQQFEVIPADSGFDYELMYHARIPALSASNPSNWLLVKAPDLYLYGACLEAAPYLKDDDRLTTWGTLRQQVIDAMNLESQRAKYSQTQLRARPRGF